MLHPHIQLPGITATKPSKASQRLEVEEIMLPSHTALQPPTPASYCNEGAVSYNNMSAKSLKRQMQFKFNATYLKNIFQLSNDMS